MKIFFVGDFISHTGPGIANKMMKKGLISHKEVIYSEAKNKVSRIIELFYKIIISESVCFCSFSRANIIGIHFSKMLHKNTFYIMHGYKTLEYVINQKDYSVKEMKKINKSEKKIFQSVHKVYCVSKKFMGFMKNELPEYSEKFSYNFNGMNIGTFKNKSSTLINNQIKIISAGGGMPRKNNLTICKAISEINKEKKYRIQYIVIGLPYSDKEQICKYDFVTYYDSVVHDDLLKLMKESYLYIQNSSFETFGLAVIEALTCGCNLLVSSETGAIDVLKNINDFDLIKKTNDTIEIKQKIEYIIKFENNERLLGGLDFELIDYRKTGESLINKIKRDSYQGGGFKKK